MNRQYKHDNNTTAFEQYCKNKKAQYGTLFSTKNLAQQFIPYLHTNTRLKIQDETGQTYFGTVGISTGWVPVFLLMHSTRSIGSSFILQPHHKITAIKTGHKYTPIETQS